MAEGSPLMKILVVVAVAVGLASCRTTMSPKPETPGSQVQVETVAGLFSMMARADSASAGRHYRGPLYDLSNQPAGMSFQPVVLDWQAAPDLSAMPCGGNQTSSELSAQIQLSWQPRRRRLKDDSGCGCPAGSACNSSGNAATRPCVSSCGEPH